MTNVRCRQRHRLPIVLKHIWTCLYFTVILPESATFMIPVASRPRSSRLQASTGTTNEEVERYRNRAALTESVLKEKMQEMKLLRNKVEVLQDVVKKLQKRQQNATSLKQEELISQWRQEETKRIEAELQIKRLQTELNHTKSELNKQATQHSEIIQELKKEHGRDRQAWKEQEREFRDRGRVVQDKIRALQKEVLDIDQSLEMTQGELMRVQKILASREDELRTLSSEEDRKRKVLEEKLETILREKNSLQCKFDELAAGEEERKESVAIASAAVRAAEKREAKLRQELETLQQKLDQLEAKYEEVAADSNDQQKVKELLQELDMERKKHADDRKRDRQEFEKKLDAQRETFEAELRLVRTSTAAEASQIDILGNEDEMYRNTQASQNSTAATSGTAVFQKSTKKGKRGIWRRLRSLLSRGHG